MFMLDMRTVQILHQHLIIPLKKVDGSKLFVRVFVKIDHSVVPRPSLGPLRLQLLRNVIGYAICDYKFTSRL